MPSLKPAPWLLLFALAASACSTTGAAERPQAASPTVRQTLLARCRRSSTDGTIAAPPPQIYVELSVLDAPEGSPDASVPPERLLSSPDARLVQSLHVLADSGVESSMPVTSSEHGGSDALFQVTPTFENAENVDLAIVYAASRMTLRIAEDQPVVLRLADRDGRPRLGVLVAQFVHTKDDLRRIYECKQRQAAAARGT